MNEEQDEDMRKIEPSTLVLTVTFVVAGVVLVALGHEAIGASLLTFATGAALTKPLMRRDR